MVRISKKKAKRLGISEEKRHALTREELTAAETKSGQYEVRDGKTFLKRKEEVKEEVIEPTKAEPVTRPALTYAEPRKFGGFEAPEDVRVATGTLPIGVGGIGKIPKFADAIRKTATSYKAIEKGDVILRNIRQIQRIARVFKIPFGSAKKIAQAWGILSPEKKVSLLTKLPIKTIGYVAAGVWGTTGIMTWMSVDNIAQSAAIFVRDAYWAAKTYPESIPEILEGFDETQAALDLARAATVITTSINPFLWPFKKLISTALDASQRQVDLFRWQVEQMEIPGAEEEPAEEEPTPPTREPIKLGG